MTASDVESFAVCEICGRKCDPESVTHSDEVTACSTCAGGLPMVQCAGGCALWCDPELGEYCNDHYYLARS